MGKYIVRGLIVIFGFAILFVVYRIGVFSVSFGANMCYSEVLSTISNQVNNAVKTGKKEDLLKVKTLLDKLPLRGYESDCDEIRNATKTYSKSFKTAGLPALLGRRKERGAI